jgi:hypothetical protein
MPRLAGVRERFDRTFYDTGSIEPGQRRAFFETPRQALESCPECGGKLETVDVPEAGPQFACPGCGGMFDSELFRTNLRWARRLTLAPEPWLDRPYVAKSIGLRLLGTDYDVEQTLLDHLHVRLALDNGVVFEQVGSLCSTVDPRFTESELAAYRAVLESHGDELENMAIAEGIFRTRPGYDTALDPQARARLPRGRVGYVLMPPIVIGANQDVRFEVSASREMPSTVRCRALVFGLASRDVT